MITPPATQLDRRLDDLNGVLRRFVSAIHGIDDFKRFLGSLERIFESISAISGRSVRFELSPESGGIEREPFSGRELSAPVVVGPRLGGLVRVEPPGGQRPFGPEDLHLVGTLAEMTGTLLDISNRLRNADAVEHMLRLVYDQLPVGVVCFSGSGGPVIANARAQLMLEGMLWGSRDDALAFLAARSEIGDSSASGVRFCFAGASGTLMAEVHEVSSPGASNTTVIVLVALDSQERNLRLSLEREIYRSRWLGQPLALVVLEISGDPGRLFARVPAIRQLLRPGDSCEVLGPSQIGLVLPGRERVQALQTVRLVGRAAGGAPLKLACRSLSDGKERADAMLAEAVAGLEPADALLRPRLLVVDRYRAVLDMVELVVGNTFAVEKAATASDGLASLQLKPVDGVVVEHEPDEGFSGLEFLQSARALQPNVAGILTSTRLDVSSGKYPTLENVQFVRKPFSVVGLRRTLAAIAPAVSPPR